jgi:hypothetical protein
MEGINIILSVSKSVFNKIQMGNNFKKNAMSYYITTNGNQIRIISEKNDEWY